jgi:polyhydroxybutyrate depolymerase
MSTLLAFAITAVSQVVLHKESYNVDGDTRTALVYTPGKVQGAPVVIAFHGHGGSSQNAARSMDVHNYWRQAMVIYPQGLPTETPNDPEGTRLGWQLVRGTNGNRDLKFFDAIVERAKGKGARGSQVYVLGHSNGGAFVYLLWEQRASQLAAVAPSGAIFTALHGITKPKPCLLITGKNDQIVNPKRQLDGHERAKRLNGAKSPGKPWNAVCTWFDGIQPTVTYVLNLGHQYPADGGEMCAEFFKQIDKQK